MEPQEVISSQGDGPYAFKIKLGWCVLGPISDRSYQNRFHFNRMIAEYHATRKIAKQNLQSQNVLRKMEPVTF